MSQYVYPQPLGPQAPLVLPMTDTAAVPAAHYATSSVAAPGASHAAPHATAAAAPALAAPLAAVVAAPPAAAAAGAAPRPAPAAPAAAAALPAQAEVLSAQMSAYNSELITHYQKLSRLGSGTYGTVYKARDRRTGEIVAIKKLRLTNEQSGFHLTSLREITLLQTTVHRNIVLLKDVVVGRRPDFVVLVFEFCEYDLGTLLDRTTRRFAVSEVKTLLQQLLRGIEYLHERGIVHRDIKLSNLLVSARGELKIADFGLARRLPFPLAPMSPTVFTLWYRAPELLLASPVYHAAADMWAVGCIMGELLLHRPLLPGGSETEQMVLISQLLGPPSAIDWPGFAALASHPRAAAALALDPAGPNYSRLAEEFQALSGAGLDLLSRLLAYDPARRITAAQAAIHPWFQEAPAPCPLHKMPVFKPQDIAQAPAQQQQQQQQQQQAPRQAQPHHEDGGGDI